MSTGYSNDTTFQIQKQSDQITEKDQNCLRTVQEPGNSSNTFPINFNLEDSVIHPLSFRRIIPLND